MVDFRITLIERIKIYIKHPSCVKSDILWCYRRNKENFMFWLRRKLITYELKHPNYTYHFDDMESGRSFNYATLFPCQVVMMVLSRHFKNVENLNIHGIIVSTADKYENEVDLHLIHCGILIGKGGETISSIEKELSEIFGKKTTIKIKEVKNDVNLYLIRRSYEY